MKIEITDVSGLPDALKTLVSETDGKHELDLAALAPVAELDKFKAKALTAQSEAIERRKALEAFKEYGTPEDIAAQLAAKGKPDADHEKIIADLKAQAAAEKEALQGQIGKMRKDGAVASLKAALAENGVIPEGMDILATYASSRISFGDDGAVKVLTADGSKPMTGNGADGGATLSDLAKELAGAIPHLVKDGGNGGGGKPAQSGGTPSKTTIKRSEYDAMTPAQQREVAQSGASFID